MCDHHFPGKVCLPDPAYVAPDGTGTPVISLDANTGDVVVGGPEGGFGHRGRLVITDQNGNPTFVVEGQTGEVTPEGDIVLRDNTGQERIRISGQGAEMVIRDTKSRQAIHLDSSRHLKAVLSIGAEKTDASLIVRDRQNREVIKAEGPQARLTLGSLGNEGRLIVRGESDPPRVEIDSNCIKLRISDDRTAAELNSYVPALMVGTRDHGGYLRVRDDKKAYAFEFRGPDAELRIGAPGNTGSIEVRDSSNNVVFAFDGVRAQLDLGNERNDGRLFVHDDENRRVLSFHGNLAILNIGTRGRGGEIRISDSGNRDTITMIGESGEILLANSNAAEQFEIADSVTAEPGMVMVLNDQGKVEPSSFPFDSRVIGVRAGDQPGEHPGIVLDHKEGLAGRVSVSMWGKVRCLANAFPEPIAVGDLLTTSAEPGHAMKAPDPSSHAGAILGKALSPLRTGMRVIDVLVTLQ